MVNRRNFLKIPAALMAAPPERLNAAVQSTASDIIGITLPAGTKVEAIRLTIPEGSIASLSVDDQRLFDGIVRRAAELGVEVDKQDMLESLRGFHDRIQGALNDFFLKEVVPRDLAQEVAFSETFWKETSKMTAEPPPTTPTQELPVGNDGPRPQGVSEGIVRPNPASATGWEIMQGGAWVTLHDEALEKMIGSETSFSPDASSDQKWIDLYEETIIALADAAELVSEKLYLVQPYFRIYVKHGLAIARAREEQSRKAALMTPKTFAEGEIRIRPSSGEQEIFSDGEWRTHPHSGVGDVRLNYDLSTGYETWTGKEWVECAAPSMITPASEIGRSPDAPLAGNVPESQKEWREGCGATPDPEETSEESDRAHREHLLKFEAPISPEAAFNFPSKSVLTGRTFNENNTLRLTADGREALVIGPGLTLSIPNLSDMDQATRSIAQFIQSALPALWDGWINEHLRHLQAAGMLEIKDEGLKSRVTSGTKSG